MGEPTIPTAESARPTEAWTAYRTALAHLVEETVRHELASSPHPAAHAGSGGQAPAELKKTVAEVMGAVLIESGILERLVEKQVKACQAAAPAGGAIAGDSEAVRQEMGKAVREYLSRHLGTLFQTEIRGVIQKEMKSILASDDLKEMLDEKFRMMTAYLRSEVIPKVIQQVLSKTEA